MRKWMFSLLSVLTLVFVLTGCNTSSGTSNVAQGDSENTENSSGNVGNNENTIIVNGQEVAAETNSFGLSAALGTPPERP